MSSSARLYERLDQIPDDPEDPESLEDVVVCAFGAFERYYVCWKTRGGAYRQDGHDLPPDLEEFLFAEADARDFASLQVVFGRGDEFFASDNNGKLEYKEPEPEKKEPSPEELEEKRALRRSRTISFMRPRSDEKQTFLDLESPLSSRRSSLINGRPPSLALSFRSNSDASLHSQPESRPPSVSHARLSSESSVSSQLWSRPSSNQTTIPSRPSSDSDIKTDDATAEPTEEEKPLAPPPIPASNQSTKRLRPLSMSFKAGLIPRIPEGRQIPPQESPSPPPPLPPMPPVPQVPTLPIPTPAKLWTATSDVNSSSSSSPPVLPLQIKQRVVDPAPDSRSVSPPLQLPEQSRSPVLAEDPRPLLSLEAVSTTAQTSPLTVPSASLSIQISDTSVATSPMSPTVTPIVVTPPPQATLSIQIVSTAVQTSPISPLPPPVAEAPAPLSPPILSLQFSALSTTLIAPVPPTPVPTSTQPAKPSTSTTSTQTSPPASPLRTALRIDTGVAAPTVPSHTYSFSTSSSALDIETPQDYYEQPPIFMGRMMDYYSKPGYQLGQSLFGGYSMQEPVFQEIEGELSEWEKANGRGY